MTYQNALTKTIDAKNFLFTSAVKSRLQNLDQFNEDTLEWLMMEHYQFSARNTEFLALAAKTAKEFDGEEVTDELMRNYNEEKTHASIYKRALFEIGTDVSKRIEFNPTTEFFNQILALISTCPSSTLGAMYATETAAIFEHEVFRSISQEVIARRKMGWEKARLKAFHDMHLNGVEQSHKDELGKFLDPDRIQFNTQKVLHGANFAIDAMIIWWDAMLDQAGNR